ncbi:MAG: flippase-like domain-containing protein [Candidatus Scalindua sp.]|nr:flippase-like domain-containing protein [Candidatus Scalindua sp.]
MGKGESILKLDKKRIVFLLGIIISGVCSWLFIRNVEWSSLNRAFSEAKYVYILPTIVIIFLSHYVRAERWSCLLAPVKKVSIANLFSATVIGFMANNVLPARVGEIIKPILIGKKENIRMSTSIATVVMERVFDILSMIVLASAVLLLLPTDLPQKKLGDGSRSTKITTNERRIIDGRVADGIVPLATREGNKIDMSTIKQLKRWSILFACLGVFAIMFLFLLSIYPEKVSAITKKLLFFLPHHLSEKLTGLIDSFISGLQIFDDKRQILWIGILSLIIWLLNAAGFYVLAYAFDIGLTFTGACFVNICLALAIALPQAPGYIGVFHIATEKTLRIFGIGMSSSQSYAILLWAVSVIPVTLAGFLFLWREHMSLLTITKQNETALE